MIDIVVADEQKSRADELKNKYANGIETKNAIPIVLADISVTLGHIWDEMRGIKGGD